LIDFVGGLLIAGGELKEVGLVHWNNPNTGAVDTYSFAARGAGLYHYLYGFLQIKETTYLWTASENDATHAWVVILQYNHADIVFPTVLKTGWGSVRLLKNFSYAPPSFGIVSDYDGNVYTYITVGTRQWLIQNFKCTHYADGTPIPNIPLAANWILDVTGAYCWYNNDAVTYADYGLLYNSYAVHNAHGLAIAGWRVPDNNDWDALITALGGILIAGAKLKETGLAHWLTPNIGAIDIIGFKALPGGLRNLIGNFDEITEDGMFWSTDIYYYACFHNAIHVSKQDYAGFEKNGISVRLVRDVP